MRPEKPLASFPLADQPLPRQCSHPEAICGMCQWSKRHTGYTRRQLKLHSNSEPTVQCYYGSHALVIIHEIRCLQSRRWSARGC